MKNSVRLTAMIFALASVVATVGTVAHAQEDSPATQASSHKAKKAKKSAKKTQKTGPKTAKASSTMKSTKKSKSSKASARKESSIAAPMPKGKSLKPNSGLSRDIVFDGSEVNGQYHSAGDAVAKVEQEKKMRNLVGLRQDFKDRLADERQKMNQGSGQSEGQNEGQNEGEL